MKLQRMYPHNVHGITIDPQPDWSFNELLSELESLDNRIINPELSGHFTKIKPKQLTSTKRIDKNDGGFSMCISSDDGYDADSLSEVDMPSAQGSRFVCDELDVSDDSENEVSYEIQSWTGNTRLTKSELNELAKDYFMSAMEKTRSEIQLMEEKLADEYDLTISSLNEIDQHRQMQHIKERKLDMDYKRTIAEALDNYLTPVQRDRENLSQSEERKIRDDAAREEAKRKEKALAEERHKAEEEARLKAEIAEKTKAMAIEAEKRAAEEAAARHASEKSTTSDAGDANAILHDQTKKKLVRASQNALELEKKRIQLLVELFGDANLRLADHQEYDQLGRAMRSKLKTITHRLQIIRKRAEELVHTINSSGFPQHISIKLFVEKILSSCLTQTSQAVFASARVIVLVNAKVPATMDILLAELNRICIYTVPKYIEYSKETFATKGSYLKAIGYVEQSGKMETKIDYITRLQCYMRLYGAIIQTEVEGFQNPHGLPEGWAWLARFLNSIPANLYTTAALRSFLETAGYALYKKYRNQFEKLLKIIGNDILNSLEADSLVDEEKAAITDYIKDRSYLKEPKEAQLEMGNLISSTIDEVEPYSRWPGV